MPASIGRPVSVAVLVLALAGLVAPAAHAGTTGKLGGRVTSDKGEPLALVTVRVEGQHIGAVSDDKGEYFILGVPAGTYVIQARRVGYATFVAQNVEIRPDFTTTLDISMPTEAVAMAPVEVKAERPLLQRDATGTTRFLDARDILNLPTRGYRDAAALQTGVVNYQRPPTVYAVAFGNGAQDQPSLVVRGGRTNETAYFVDGFSQQNPLTGNSSTSISNNAIQEVVVLTGGFAPEYGRVMSGAVNVITREGGNRFSGSLETVTDQIAGRWVGAPRTDYNVYDLSLGGPLLPRRDNLTFYVSSERRWEGDRSPSYMPDDVRAQLQRGTNYALNSQGQTVFVGEKFNPDIKPNNSSSVYSLQGKVSWRLNDRMNLHVGGLGSRDDWREYEHAYLFTPTYMPRHRDQTESYYGTFNQKLGDRSFYQVGLNYFRALSKTGSARQFDDLTGYARLYQPNPPSPLDLDFPQFFTSSAPVIVQLGQGTTYLQSDSRYVGAQASWTGQVTPHHQLRVGGDFQRHSIRRISIINPVSFGGPAPAYRDVDGFGYRIVTERYTTGPDSGSVKSVHLEDVNDGLDGVKHPKTFALYAQDKFEYEGVIVNGGLRLDYFDVNTPALRNEAHPLGDPNEPGNLPDSLEARDLESNRKYTRVSPRLGIAFPVDERTILRFNYGIFYQQPNLNDLYVNYAYLQYLIRVHPYTVPIGNPDLRPERTTAFEVGIARLLTERVRLDLTAYQKITKDLIEVANLSNSAIPVPLYRNQDYGTVKGVDVGLTVRPTHNLGANLAYSLALAEGTGSSSTSQFRIAWVGGNIPTMTAPLDFDQRHKISLGLDWTLGPAQGPKIGSGTHPLENTAVNVVLNAGSGTPYTPDLVYDETSQGVTSPRPAAPLNARYGPWTASVDLKVTRTIPLAGYRFDVYAWVLNLLNRQNVIDVYRSSGSPSSTDWLSTPDGQTFLQTAASRGVDGQTFYSLAEHNPNLYSNPRLVRVGLRVSF